MSEKMKDDQMKDVAGGFDYNYSSDKYGNTYENIKLNERERNILRKKGVEFTLYDPDNNEEDAYNNYWKDGEIKNATLNGKELSPKEIASLLAEGK